MKTQYLARFEDTCGNVWYKVGDNRKKLLDWVKMRYNKSNWPENDPFNMFLMHEASTTFVRALSKTGNSVKV